MSWSRVKKATGSLRRGGIVLVYDADGREEETDLVVASQYTSPEAVRILRRDGGGLICTTVPSEAQARLGLPLLSDLFQGAGKDYPILRRLIPNDLPYDEKSSFGLTINYRGTFTGITDIDRSMTIREFAHFLGLMESMDDESAKMEFGRRFRSPGHIHLLNVANPLLVSRRGHTELSTALIIMSHLIPSATICEMMADNGRAVSRDDAKHYARKNNLVFLEGEEIVEAWEKWSE